MDEFRREAGGSSTGVAHLGSRTARAAHGTGRSSTYIEVPGDKGEVAAKPFSQCSVEEMRQALQHKRKPGSSKPMPPGAMERGEQYHLAVKALFPKVTTVEVQVRNIKGKAVVDFKGIPLEQVDRLTEVLTGELPPVPKVPLLEKLLPQA